MLVQLIGGDHQYKAEQELQKVLREWSKGSGKGGKVEVRSYYADEVKSLNEITELAGSMGMFTSDSIVVIKGLLKDGTSLLKEQILELIKTNSSNTNLILFERGKVDKRSKLYKELQSTGKVYEYTYPKKFSLAEFVGAELKQRGLKCSNEVKYSLLSRLNGCSEFNALSELDKLQLLSQYEERTELQLKDLDLLNQDIEQEIWQLFELALQNKAAAFDLLDELWKQEVHFSLVIGFLANQLRQLLNYHYHITNLPSFIERRVAGLAQRVDRAKLTIALSKLVDLDIALKSSKLEPRVGLIMYLAIL